LAIPEVVAEKLLGDLRVKVASDGDLLRNAERGERGLKPYALFAEETARRRAVI